jgi:methyl-accepting chemotaxis protein
MGFLNFDRGRAWINIMSIKKKLISASVLLIALFLFMIIMNKTGNSSVMNKIITANELEKETMHLQGIFKGVNEFIIDEGEPLSIELTRKHLEGFETIHENLMAGNRDRDLKDTLKKEVDPQWQMVKSGVESFLKIEDISVEDDDAMLRYGSLTAKAKTLIKQVETLAAKMEKTARAASKKTEMVMNVTATVIISVMCLLLYTLYRSINLPIHGLTAFAEGFGKGDFSILANESGKDEFGRLGSYFNKAAARLGEMIANVKTVALELTSNSEKLYVSALEINRNANEQSDQTAHAASAMEELSSSFVEVAGNATNAAHSAKEAAELAVKGGQVMEETISGMNRISKSVSESAHNIEELGERSEQIGVIVQVINDIASQTSLLALNAAIEAARAGEHGRGFAVVADEVKKLAERTTSATDEIDAMIKGIQHDTSRAIASMKNGTGEVEKGVSLAGEADESLKHIVTSVQKVTDMVHHVAAAAEQQSSTGAAVTTNVESIARLAKCNGDSADKSSATINNMVDTVGELNSLVSEFRLQSHDNAVLNNSVQDYDMESQHITAEHPEKLNA